MFQRDEVQEIAPLTPMQRGMLHHALIEQDSATHHEQLVLCLHGPVEAERLEQAWQMVVDRHQALRGRFLSQRVSTPVHVVLRHEPVMLQRRAVGGALDRFDEASAPGTAPADALPPEVEAWLAQDRATGFDLEAAHAMRLMLFSDGRQRHWLVWSFHHILLDGWSISLVLDEVLDCYAAHPLPPVADLGPWRRWLAALDTAAGLDHWQQALDGLVFDPWLPAPGDLAEVLRPARAELGELPTQALRRLAAGQRTSLQHMLLAAWALVVGRFADARDVLVPTLLAGRPEAVPEASAMVGMFINTVPMRLRWQPTQTFAEFLAQVRDHSLDALMHSQVSLADIQARTGTLPLDHVLIVQAQPGAALLCRDSAGMRVGGAVFREETPYALKVSLVPEEHRIGIELEGRLPLAWRQAVADALRQLLTELAQQPESPAWTIDRLSQATAAQRAQVLAWVEGGQPPPYRSVIDAWDTAVQRHPQALALVARGRRWSYRELHAWVQAVQAQVQSQAPALSQKPSMIGKAPLRGSMPPVAVLAHRDGALPAAVLGVLRAGAVYLPLDPQQPHARLAAILAKAGCRQVLAAPDLQGLIKGLPGVQVIPLLPDEPGGYGDLPAQEHASPAPARLHASDPAYLMFTSGSSGEPKGVQLSHGNLASVLVSVAQATGLGAQDRMLGLTTVSFDISLLELLGPLCWGGTLVLADEDEARDPQRLLTLLAREGVTALQTTPSRLALLLDAAGPAPLASLRHILVGGEALPARLAQRLLALAPTQAHNMYGPTETAIWSACWALAPGPVQLGRALAGEQLWVLGQDDALQPPGALGEIVIGGVGVAQGYLGDPTRTAQRFRVVPGLAGRVYFTGDRARWRPDGALEFCGRRDGQVKLRGVRIELGEIEHLLLQQPGVQAAAATVHAVPGRGDELVGYVLAAQPLAPAALEALRRTLADGLPPVMVPASILQIEALPLSPAGKLDRQRLPLPAATYDRDMATAAAVRIPRLSPAGPATQAEAVIARVFAEVLGRQVDTDQDFFHAGGHSLLAIQAVGRINRALDAGYTLRDFYRSPSITGLARHWVGAGLVMRREADAGPDHPMSAQQQALWVLQQRVPDYTGYNVPGAYHVRGELDVHWLARAWGAVVARHEILRTVFVSEGAQAVQRVLPVMSFQIEQHRLAPGDPPEPWLHEITCRPFDLALGPLFRLAVLWLGPAECVWLLITHHIISDGWSDDLLLRDLQAAWDSAEPAHALAPAPRLRPGDYARWQQRYLASPQAQAHRAFWRERLQQLPRLSLPASSPRATGLRRPGARVAWSLSPADATQWLAQVPAIERYAALVTAAVALLHLESGQDDVMLGLPVAHRERPELQDQVGLLLNTLPLRHRSTPDLSLQQLRHDCAHELLEVLGQADYPFACLVQDLALGAEPGCHPVFDAMLIFHQQPVPVPSLSGLVLQPWPGQSYTSRFDLDIEAWIDGAAVQGFIEYDSGLFEPAQAKAFADLFERLLLSCMRTPHTLLAEAAGNAGARAAEHQAFTAGLLALDKEF